MVMIPVAMLYCACNNSNWPSDPDEVRSILTGAWQLDKVVSDSYIQQYEDGKSEYIVRETTKEYAERESVLYFYPVDSCSRWTYSYETNKWENKSQMSAMTYSLSESSGSILLTISSVDRAREGEEYICGTPVTIRYNVKCSFSDIKKGKLILEHTVDYIMTSDRNFHSITYMSYYSKEYTLYEYLYSSKK